MGLLTLDYTISLSKCLKSNPLKLCNGKSSSSDSYGNFPLVLSSTLCLSSGNTQQDSINLSNVWLKRVRMTAFYLLGSQQLSIVVSEVWGLPPSQSGTLIIWLWVSTVYRCQLVSFLIRLPAPSPLRYQLLKFGIELRPSKVYVYIVQQHSSLNSAFLTSYIDAKQFNGSSTFLMNL